MKEFFFAPTYSLIKIPDNFGWGVLTGLITTLVLFIVRWMWRGVRTLLKMYQRFTLAGIWIGKCKLPSYPPGEEAIEIYRLKTAGDHVTFKFFNYLHTRRPEIIRYDGEGIARSQLFSAFYYVPLRNSSESGVISVRKRGDRLKGTYAQYDLANEELKQSPDDFLLTRIQLPLFKRLKMRLNRPPYRTYTEAKATYDATYPEAKAKYDATLEANGSPDEAKPAVNPQV